ncbi:DUF6528 family protein [Actinacidiphila oryziradicis]|uniref:Uncharacterized protein n=1 Tax=Actinacidiphila oryziradicis TaxID=2571141 RepID=A0A4U0SBP7_9ACTN|nr:DUF6528 family protein [Actinacidiphila oryziradicis]TKA06203.1 hypothetical protein FCI23_32915 [Actinacidiphila oryziradicis]
MTNYLGVTTEQTTNDIIVFDQDADWATAGAVKWRWSAPGGAGTVWDNLSDVRMRSTRAYGPVVLVAASGGWVGMLRRDSKKVVWHAVPGGNPHAVERIAGGVIVVASSASGELRLYADSTHTEPFRTIALEMAHGVLYDPAHSCLWAIGHQHARVRPPSSPCTAAPPSKALVMMSNRCTGNRTVCGSPTPTACTGWASRRTNTTRWTAPTA